MNKELTDVGEAILSTPQNDIKLDGYIKNILKYKPVLSRIFKETVSECRKMEYSEIEKCIGEIAVSEIPLNPGMSNPSKIVGDEQEDFVIGEGKVTYDLRMSLYIPNSDAVEVKLLVDVEAQKDDEPGYDISERAIFYCCRMISGELSTEFTNKSNDRKKYSNIKKVYSIWICTETSDERANTIEEYFIKRRIHPTIKETKIPRYDLMRAVIVNISKAHNTGNSDSEMIKVLTTLFNETMDAQRKIEIMDEHGIETTKEFEEEVSGMTAYAAGLLLKGETRGKDKWQELLANTIQRLKNGETPESIIASGVDANTVALAQTCL